MKRLFNATAMLAEQFVGSNLIILTESLFHNYIFQTYIHFQLMPQIYCIYYTCINLRIWIIGTNEYGNRKTPCFFLLFA